MLKEKRAEIRLGPLPSKAPRRRCKEAFLSIVAPQRGVSQIITQLHTLMGYDTHMHLLTLRPAATDGYSAVMVEKSSISIGTSAQK